MEQGYVIGEGRSGPDTREYWIESLPKRDIWFGRLDTSAIRVLPVRTYRCILCGYLESYAPDDAQNEE
jgi:hypothetical protein